jgi:hypothetical protein
LGKLKMDDWLTTGRGVEDFDNEWANYYYVPYSDVYHTSENCPHIKNSENLVAGSAMYHLDGPLRAGGYRVAMNDLEKCSWCESNEKD